MFCSDRTGPYDAETRFFPGGSAKWFAVCQKGIWDKAFRYSEKGDTKVLIEGLPGRQDGMNSSISGLPGKVIRFTFMLKAPETRAAVIKSLKPEKSKVRASAGAPAMEFSQYCGS